MKNPKKSPYISYSQNEMVNQSIIEKLVNQSSISNGDLVYDIGAGTGAISMALLKKGARVIAIEKDYSKYLKCKERFIGQDRFELYLDDFLLRDFSNIGKYKVFSSIPFFHTAEIINRILFCENPPEDSYLVLQREAAEKYAGIPEDTLASLVIKPLFWVDIIYHFERADFHPVPSVDVALLQVEKRRCPLVPIQQYSLYKDFIVSVREGADTTINKSLKWFFTYTQVKQLTRLMHIDFRSSPTELNFTQYLCLFQFYLSHSVNSKTLIQGAEQKLRQQQANIVKMHRTRSIGDKF
jgi:16S rRNA A1518/A1519 N6-dimethyltransferase RsmA/KsgA/DIM1 with predicted DNA glycosylase/AP lyase activity